MKIIDPALCPDDFGLLQFEPLLDERLGSELFGLTVDVALVGELSPLYLEGEAEIVIDEDEGFSVPGAGCWTLALTDCDGRVARTHILCTASQSHSEAQSLTGEVAVWATLTAIWATSDRVYQRG